MMEGRENVKNLMVVGTSVLWYNRVMKKRTGASLLHNALCLLAVLGIGAGSVSGESLI